MTKTHNDVIREVSNEGWNFNQRFIRAITHPKNEYVEKSALAYAFGAEVETTGKHFCPYCDEYFTNTACDGFEERVKDILRREVIEPYMEKHCPDCEQKIEDMTVVQDVEDIDAMGEATFNPDIDAHEVFEIGCEEKRRYEPCGCLHEIGEEEILWDLDKEKVEEEVSFYGYGGPIFNG